MHKEILIEEELMQKRTVLLRQNILRQSFQLFLEKGYEDTTTREIAAACGIKQGALYYHFKQKHNILAEIYGTFFSFLCQQVEQQFSEEGPVQVMLSDILLYRLLFKREALFMLLVSLLKTHELVSEKIDKTTEAINGLLPIGSEKIHFGLTIAIGAEVELVLQIAAGELDLSPEQLARWVAGTVLNVLGHSLEDTDRIYKAAIECADRFDEKAFAKNMEQQTGWFYLDNL